MLQEPSVIDQQQYNGNMPINEQYLSQALQNLQIKMQQAQESGKENQLEELQKQMEQLMLQYQQLQQYQQQQQQQQQQQNKQMSDQKWFQEDQFQQYPIEMQQFQGDQNGQNGYIQQNQQEQEPQLDDLLQLDNEYDSEDEGIQDYKIGGYHTVHIGEVLLNRYVIIQKIGWGHFSTVWLAKDFKYETYVALKIQKSAPHYLEAAYDEVEILQKVARKCQDKEWIEKLKNYHSNEVRKFFTKDDCQVVQLLNSFIYKGPYGNHFCFVFEILGVNLLEVIKRYNYQGVPLHLTRKIAKQCLVGLDFLHEQCKVIHTDLKPENVLLQLTKQEIKDIVENGQMSKRKVMKERIHYIRKKIGIRFYEDEEDLVLDELKLEDTTKFNNNSNSNNNSNNHNIKQQQEDQEEEEKKIVPGMTKNQRKNIKRKQKRKNKKKQEFLQKQQLEQQNNNDHENEEETQDNTVVNESQNNTQQQQLQQQQMLQEEEEEPMTLVQLFDKNYQKQKEKENKERMQAHNNNNLANQNPFMKGPALDSDFSLKIADLGNACWNHHHFATEIQTRQYRSPEVIVEADYNPTADIWSLACMLFEMLTGDFLFEPRKGPNFSKNEDHLAQMQELIGKFDPKFSTRGKISRRYFDNHGNLKKIPQLHFWPIKNVLVEKYKFKESEALQFQDFLLQMLHPQPEKRATAKDMLNHPWLNLEDNYNVKMTDEEHGNYLQKRKRLQDLLGKEYNPINDEHFIKQGGKYDREIGHFDNEVNDGDREDNSNISELSENEDEFYDYKPQIDMNAVDRSFTNLGYIGYGDGIDLTALDNTGNWQFDNV